jgi:CBS domain-containing protein
MKVHEIMTAHPHGIGPNNTLVEAAGLMRELDVGALPVFDDDELAGLVTDRDLVVRGLADGRDPNSATVSEVMSGGVQYIFADQEVEVAAHMMESAQVRRLPVMDREKRLVGIISLGDIATSSNPAFSGLTLRDVSEPNEPTARRRRLSRESEPTRMPNATAGRRGPTQAPRAAKRRARSQAKAPAPTKRRTARKSRRQARNPSAGTRAPRGGKKSARR